MIRVTVELVPGGVGEPQLLGVAEITNDGTGTADRGNYDVTLSKWAPKQDETWKRGSVRGFLRKKLGAWDLLLLALCACGVPQRVHGTGAQISMNRGDAVVPPKRGKR